MIGNEKSECSKVEMNKTSGSMYYTCKEIKNRYANRNKNANELKFIHFLKSGTSSTHICTGKTTR